MTRVPIYGGRQAERLRSGRQKAILVGGVPVPADRPDIRVEVPCHEVHRKPELVRGLEWPRFAGPLLENIKLPVSTAICLEDFEQGLRSAGLMAPDEVLRQRARGDPHFRVEKVEIIETYVGHALGSFGEPGAPPSGARSPASTKVPARSMAGASVKAEERQRALTDADAMLPVQVERVRLGALQARSAKGAQPPLVKQCTSDTGGKRK